MSFAYSSESYTTAQLIAILSAEETSSGRLQEVLQQLQNHTGTDPLEEPDRVWTTEDLDRAGVLP
jgi:hypothetical protein